MGRFISIKERKENFDHIGEDLSALQSLLSFARIDAQENDFSIVDITWPIYKELVHVYNSWDLRHYLYDNGITIQKDEFDDIKVCQLYEISYSKD